MKIRRILASRLFVGIPVSEEIQGKLKKALQELQELGADLRVVAPENFHLTGVFLGEADPEITKTKLRLITGKPFSASVRGIGAFPSPEEPRVIWVGVLGEEIISLVEKIQQVFAKPEEHHPHITLARVKSDRSIKKVKGFIQDHAPRDFGMMNVDKVVLYQSTLTRQGAVYQILEEVFLK